MNLMNTQEKIYTVVSKLSPKNVSLNISDFVSLIRQDGFDPEIERESLARGFYGTYFSTNIWIDKTIKPGTVHISNQDVINKFSDGDWSPVIYLDWAENDIEKIEKMWKMKVFW